MYAPSGARRPHLRRRGGLVLAAGITALGATGVLGAPASAQSRTAAGATTITPNVFHSYTFGAADDANQASGVSCNAQDLLRPVYYRFAGTGGRVIVTTNFTETAVDSMVFNYGAGQTPPSFGGATCGDDEIGNKAQMVFDSVAGATHFLAIGVCCTGQVPSGRVGYSVITNDQRAHAVAPGPEHFNHGTSADDPGEPTSCAGFGYTQTTWYAYTAPARGTIAPNFHAVAGGAITAFRGASNTPIGCAVTSQGFTQLAPVTVARGETIMLQAGTNSPSLVHVSSVNFVRNPDQDGDGVNGGVNADCQDEDPAIKPGLPEIPNNPVDENCDGIVGLDRDGDGEMAIPGGPDCNDGNRAINTRGREIRGNRADEDCKGGAAPLRRFARKPLIEGVGRGSRTFITTFSVARVPAKTKIELKCSTCRRKKVTLTLRVPRAQVNMATRLRPRLLRAGTVLELKISRREFRTEALRVTLRAGKRPVLRSLCAAPGKPLRKC